MARTILCALGGVTKSNVVGSRIPIPFNCNMTCDKLTRKISGILVSSSCSYAASVYNRKHIPDSTRPARPLRCAACARLISDIDKHSIPVLLFGIIYRHLYFPVSMTYLMDGMVMDVSAMLVAKITFRRQPTGFSRKAFNCASGGKAAYRTQIITPATMTTS